MKNLFVLVADGGDGSYFTRYTFNAEWIKSQTEKHDNDQLDYEFALGVDGDGFHYEILTVPNECTLESLGIRSDCAK